MSRLFTKHLSLAMLVIFMTNMGVWSFHSNWLAHELEHSGKLMLMTVSADHVDMHKIGALDDNDEKTPSALEHQLLHVVDHPQLFPSVIFSGIFSFPPSIVLSYFTPLNVPLATFEAPFRPPRSTAFLIQQHV